jgi:ABC-type proline/glycine betaine transport system permease subunit
MINMSFDPEMQKIYDNMYKRNKTKKTRRPKSILTPGDRLTLFVISVLISIAFGFVLGLVIGADKGYEKGIQTVIKD